MSTLTTQIFYQPFEDALKEGKGTLSVERDILNAYHSWLSPDGKPSRQLANGEYESIANEPISLMYKGMVITTH